jgi:D-beta-D-heptose 7-phosphate kinase/D-beta-D-heptose 1-phosphate adenosyltransferase
MELAAAGVSTHLLSTPNFPTTSKVRILSGHQQMLRIDFENTGNRPSSVYEELIRQAREVLPSCSAVVLSDYAKGVLSDQVCAVLIEDARALGIPVLVDPKSAAFGKYRNATTVCPNLQELALAVSDSSRVVEKQDVEKLLDLGEQSMKEYGFDFLTVTLGDKGIAVVGKGKRNRAPAVARQVFDVSGAGDTVIATLALCLACGIKVDAAIEVANVAAGIVISKVGTVPIERNELIGALSQDHASYSSEKVVAPGHLRARVAAWRAAGQRIVFTNGCFDLLHAGHIHLLESARQLGDKLIVAINSDSSTRRLKGPTRPVVGEHERATVLAALAAIDVVVIFDESTPLELIRAVRPDVLVKGGDYTEDGVEGATVVRALGGRVCLIPLVRGFSTSELVEAAKRRNA